MDNNLIPPQILGLNLKTLSDLSETVNQEGVPLGGYIRISTKKESQKTSIENQKKYLKEWTEINKYNLVEYYLDVKTGKYLYARNDMKKMLQDLKEGTIKGIVSKEIARTSRDVTDIIDIKRRIVNCGGFFIAIKENYDSRTDDDEFLLILHGAISQKESRTTASRLKLSMIKANRRKTK